MGITIFSYHVDPFSHNLKNDNLIIVYLWTFWTEMTFMYLKKLFVCSCSQSLELWYIHLVFLDTISACYCSQLSNSFFFFFRQSQSFTVTESSSLALCDNAFWTGDTKYFYVIVIVLSSLFPLDFTMGSEYWYGMLNKAKFFAIFWRCQPKIN